MTRSMVLATFALAVGMTVGMASPAMAQAVCGERVAIVNALEAGHQEQKTAAGLSGNGGVVELFTASSGSWTLLLTLPGGPTCLLGAGEAWEGWAQNLGPKGPQNMSAPAVAPGGST